MISYAQNAEDVVLARALPGDTGFYVDVGAADPSIASVTRHFYDRGWHGINIEPRPDALARLAEQRPRDINLGVAAGSHHGTVEFCLVHDDPDLSTTVLRDLVRSTGRDYLATSQTVEMRSLDEILEEHRVESVDFLKIDVEGAELDVLRGIDLARWCPTVIVIEAVEPYSHVRTDQGWRRILEEAGYVEGCFDGVNLFFARPENPTVLQSLVPASAIDVFKTAYVNELEGEVARLRAHVRTLEKAVVDGNHHQAEVADYVQTLEGRLGVVSSRSVTPSARRRVGPGIRPARVALCGTPGSGEGWIGRILAGSLDVPQIPVPHPADIEWGRLPDQFVIQLHWPRTRLLEQHFHDEGVIVISVARHPLDVLLSLAQFAAEDRSVAGWAGGDKPGLDDLRSGGDGGPRFVEWATSSVAERLLKLTPDWWVSPSTVRARYESWFADPGRELASLLIGTHITAEKDVDPAVDGHDLPASDPPGAWTQVLSSTVANRLSHAHRDVLNALGYGLSELG